MALTNYLTQTVVGADGLLWDRVRHDGTIGPVWWPLMVVAMISAQVAFSRWWLTRFAFGPMEWIWRQATYGRRLAITKGA